MIADSDADRKQVAKNLHRRHLDESQRSMVAARLATMKQGARTDIASIDAMSQTQAAELLNVSRQTALRSGLSQSSFGRVAQ